MRANDGGGTIEASTEGDVMSTVMPEFDALVAELEPAVILDETDREVVIEIRMPAVELRQLDVDVLDDTIEVACERGVASFQREYDLPFGIDTPHVALHLDEHALEIRLPKTRREPRRVEAATRIPGFHPEATPC
jgi:HSP20 family molecular chaperone IbpA